MIAHPRHVLADMIATGKWTRGVELGVYKGETLFYLIEHFPALRMVAVDTWEAMPGVTQDKQSGATSYVGKPMMAIGHEVALKAGLYRWRISILKLESDRAATIFDNGEFDFVFVDADHRTEAVIADCRAWLPKIRAGGMMVGHDEDWPSVRAALSEVFGTWAVLPANMWARAVP